MAGIFHRNRRYKELRVWCNCGFPYVIPSHLFAADGYDEEIFGQKDSVLASVILARNVDRGVDVRVSGRLTKNSRTVRRLLRRDSKNPPSCPADANRKNLPQDYNSPSFPWVWISTVPNRVPEPSGWMATRCWLSLVPTLTSQPSPLLPEHETLASPSLPCVFTP